LKLIESFGGESPVLVVLNKQREHPFDVNQRQLQGQISLHSRLYQDRLR
jgi:hypothetical protein